MNARVLGILIGVVIVMVLGYFIALRPGAHQAETTISTPAEEAKPRSTTRADAVMLSCKRIGERTEVTGRVTNTGTRQLTRVEVQSIWKDDTGRIVSTGTVHAVSAENPLGPGDARVFTDTTSLRAIARCNVRVLDVWSEERNDQTQP